MSSSEPLEPIPLSVSSNGQVKFPNNLQHVSRPHEVQLQTNNKPVDRIKPNPFFNSKEKQKHINTNSASYLPATLYEGSFCRRSFDGRSGYCILAYQCLHVIREFRIHGTKIDICTYRKNIPVICCTLADKHIDEQRISAKKCQEYHEAIRGVKIGRLQAFSGKQCQSSLPMIVGGEVTKTGDYPHMVCISVQFKFQIFQKNFLHSGCLGLDSKF